MFVMTLQLAKSVHSSQSLLLSLLTLWTLKCGREADSLSASSSALAKRGQSAFPATTNLAMASC